MSSTYTTANGIELINTGEQSGAWGDTTNTNLQIVDRVLTGIGSITLSGTAHTLTTTYGTLSEGMYRVLVLGGSPSGTNTITVAPDDAQKTYMVYNNSGESAIFTQGSGANVTVANGDAKLIYMDGAGSGAAVFDFTANLAMSSVNITGGVVNGVSSTGVAFTGDATFGDNDKAIFGAGSDLQIYHDGDDSRIDDAGNGNLILRGNGEIKLDKYTGEKMAKFVADGAVTLYHDNAAKLETTATGIDVTGTITSDGLTVDGDNSSIDFTGTTGNNLISVKQGLRIDIDSDNDQGATTFDITHGGTTANIFTASENGNISFYEDTGTTPKFFWDASAESLGIGTDSSTSLAHTLVLLDDMLVITQVSSPNNTSGGVIKFGATGETGAACQAEIQVHRGSDQNTGDLSFSTANGSSVAEAMRIDSSGNVGIGTSIAQSSILHVEDTGDTTLTVKALSSGAGNDDDANLVIDASGGGEAKINFSLDGAEKASIEWFNGGPDLNIKTASGTNGNIDFQPNGSLSMRIDSSGNLLVGKTSEDQDAVGGQIKKNGIAAFTSSGTSPLRVNRTVSEGNIFILQSDGSTIGSIGVNGGIAYVSNASGGGLRYHQHGVQPCDTSGSGDDNSKNLGSSTFRFDNIYATNSTIQTSDRNEKQDIASLTPTEMLVAARLSTGFKNFKWKDRVASKGDDARLHSGAISQDVQDAFTEEGLDAGNYAMFISSTWWEHDVDVPAVEAVEGVAGVQAVQAVDYAEAVEATYDEDGIELTAYVPEVQAVEAVVGVEYVEAVEAKDAYTRTDTYDTLEEAPEGSTERTRLGIRYPELLSFVAAYNEQRFASIETRLKALEA